MANLIEEGNPMNPYIWKLYLEDGGHETVTFLQHQFTQGINEAYIGKIKEFQQVYCACSELIDENIYNNITHDKIGKAMQFGLFAFSLENHL
jgi:hypothetical protein